MCCLLTDVKKGGGMHGTRRGNEVADRIPFGTELRPSLKPRRGCLFIDRDCKPISFLFVFRRLNQQSQVANRACDFMFDQFSSFRLEPPKNKKKGRENSAGSINRQPLRGLEDSTSYLSAFLLLSLSRFRWQKPCQDAQISLQKTFLLPFLSVLSYHD